MFSTNISSLHSVHSVRRRTGASMHVPCYNMQNIKKGKTQHSLRPCVAGRHAMTCRSQCNCENTNRMLAVHSCRQRKAQLSAPPVSRRNHLAACRVLRRGMSRRGVTLQSPGQGAFGERIVTYAAGLWHHTQGQHTTPRTCPSADGPRKTQ